MTLGATPMVAANILPQALREYRRRGPEAPRASLRRGPGSRSSGGAGGPARRRRGALQERARRPSHVRLPLLAGSHPRAPSRRSERSASPVVRTRWRGGHRPFRDQPASADHRQEARQSRSPGGDRRRREPARHADSAGRGRRGYRDHPFVRPGGVVRTARSSCARLSRPWSAWTSTRSRSAVEASGGCWTNSRLPEDLPVRWRSVPESSGLVVVLV